MKKSDYQQITKDVMIVYNEVLRGLNIAPKQYKKYVKKNYSKYDDTILNEKDLIQKYVREQALLNYYFSILKLINPKFNGRTLNSRFYHLQVFQDIHTKFINKPEDVVELFLYSSRILLEKKNKYFCEFFTPSPVAQILINQIKKEELLDSKNNFLDPSCGIGNLLTTLLIQYSKLRNSEEDLLMFIESQLSGYDILPFSVLSTKIQILTAFYLIVKGYNKVLSTKIKLIDTLEDSSSNKFTHIIANPPYKKIRQIPKTVESYKNITYGHLNLYSIFILWSINKLKENGALVFLVPEMLRTGRYNQLLREKINQELHIDSVCLFPEKRNLFYDAEQRVMSIRISKSTAESKTKVTTFNKSLSPKTLCLKKENFIRNFKLKNIWVFPNTLQTKNIICKINAKSNPFDSNNDFVVGNGSYVWNQRKKFLTNRGIPLIYSNSISDEGLVFPFSFKNEDKKEFSMEFYESKIFDNELLVIKRTTGESAKRISSCVVNKEFLKRYKYYYLENHVNYIKSASSKGENLLNALNQYINSKLVNFYFSKVSANQHLSVYEIGTLPLNLELLNEISELSYGNAIEDEIIYHFFKLTKEERTYIENSLATLSPIEIV